MKKYSDLSIKTYLNKLASKSPVPGGGSTAALFGAMGCALAEMVLNYSDNKNTQTIKKATPVLKSCRRHFIKLIDKDAAAYNKLSLYQKRYSKNSYRRQSALKNATLIPFKICNKSYEVMKICSRLLGVASKNLISDVGCATSAIMSAFKSAKYNVAINIRYVKDENFVNSIRKKTALLSRKISLLEEDITRRVEKDSLPPGV